MAFSRRGVGPRDGGPSSVFWGCCVVLQCFRLAEEAPGVWFGSAAGREQCDVRDRPGRPVPTPETAQGQWQASRKPSQALLLYPVASDVFNVSPHAACAVRLRSDARTK